MLILSLSCNVNIVKDCFLYGEIKMIVTVTMNPAIDKTVELTSFIHGGLNRIKQVEYDAGGKGINVSKTICELGGKSIATGFLAGNSGETILRVLKKRGIHCDFVTVPGETRTNTKVVEEDGTLTELNEPGPIISEVHLTELQNKLLTYANEDTLFIFAGSIPTGVSKDIYGKLITLVKEKGATVILDADGEVFRNAVESGPDYIKPNHVELEAYCGLPTDANESELVKAAKTFALKGVKNVVISMGKSGALFFLDGYKVKCPGLSVKTHSTVGAGDAMVAALAYAWDKKLEKEEMVKLCMATSAGAVTTIGTKPPSREVVDGLMEQVIIKKIGE